MNLGCHGKEERCFHIYGRPLPVCSRCLGVYMGLGCGFLSGLILSPEFIGITAFSLIILTFLAIIPLALDSFFQEYFGIESTNERRLITGLFTGAMLGFSIWWMLAELFY